MSSANVEKKTHKNIFIMKKWVRKKWPVGTLVLTSFINKSIHVANAWCISNRFQILEPANLIETSEIDFPKFVQNLVESYDERSTDGMLDKIARLRRFSKAAKVTKEESLGWTSLRFLEFVNKYELSDSLPNLSLALILCASISSCKRSFCKLKLIKNYLRSTMNKAWHSNLGFYLIESCVAKNIDFDDVTIKICRKKI